MSKLNSRNASSVGARLLSFCYRFIVPQSRTQFVPMGMFALCALAPIGTLQSDETAKLNDGFQVAETDWPWWRGPSRNGIASANQTPPTQWSSESNIAWKAPIPGRGHGSPTLFGDCIFFQTADESTGAQLVLCLDRSTGKQLWKTVVHPSGGMRKNSKSTAASSAPACDGQRVFVNFPNSGALLTTALDFDGKQLWQTKICDYIEHQGFGSSPALYQSLVLVSADNKAGGAIAGLDRKTGQVIWSRERPRLPNYPSPILLNVAGKDQLIMTGCDLVSSFEPLTGKTNWEVPGATTECVTSTVTDGKRVFTSGGYPKNHMSAILADGSGKLEWENESRVYVPSLLVRDGYLYGVLDAGIAVCWSAETGKEQWKARLGGTFSSSPVLVGDTIFATNESGETFLYRADPKSYVELGKNKLGDEVLSTMVVCGSKIYYRAAVTSGPERQEFLYCLSK
jgi:outer membrane protein assembly factor BamB